MKGNPVIQLFDTVDRLTETQYELHVDGLGSNAIDRTNTLSPSGIVRTRAGYDKNSSVDHAPKLLVLLTFIPHPAELIGCEETPALDKPLRRAW